MDKIRWRPELILLILGAAISRFWSLFFPNAVVFDEVYFKSFASHYLDGHFFFDIHPPLGKLLLALLAYVLHLSPAVMQNGTAVQLRMLPALAGVLIVPVTWGILRRLGASRAFAFLGGAAIVLDNALLVESRFILVDSMLLLFGLSAVYFYLVFRDSKTKLAWLWLTLAAAFSGAALSTKWTGLNALGIILVVWAWEHRTKAKPLLKSAGELAILVLIPAVIYTSLFWVHFKLLPLSGDGDAFMSPQFQATLIGSPYYNPHDHMSFFQKFIDLNSEMFLANATLTATHPYGSHWYMWPLEIRPIYYWEGPLLANGDQGNIYLLGNPVIWWGIWIAIIIGAAFVYASSRKLSAPTVAALSLCALAYFINFLPFTMITRIMFLYHYLFALVYSLLFAIILWNDILRHQLQHVLTRRQKQMAYAACLLLMAIGFAYFAPLSYGTPMSASQIQAHMWLHSWR